MEKVMITAAICGSYNSKEEAECVPYTLAEFESEAKAAYEAGAAIIHVHAKNDDGTPAEDPARIKAVIDAVKKGAPEAIIIYPAEGGAISYDQIEDGTADHLPEMMTIPTGSCNWGGYGYVNEYSQITRQGELLKKNNIAADLETFDKGMIDSVVELQDSLPGHIHFDFILGIQMKGTPDDVAYLAHCIPAGATWTASGHDKQVWEVAAAAILHGGHVRVGFEDSCMLEPGVPAKSNGDMVAKAAMLIKMLGREVATPADARSILGITK